MDLKTADIRKAYFKYLFPNLFSGLFMRMYSLVDMVVIWQYFPAAGDEIMDPLQAVEDGFATVNEKVAGHETLFLMIGGGYITFYGPEGRFAMVH